jgi:hypothetical protein
MPLIFQYGSNTDADRLKERRIHPESVKPAANRRRQVTRV